MRTRIVPVEPTGGMLAGVEDPFVGTVKMDDVIRDIYADMLSAAPPVSEELVEKVARIIDPSSWRVMDSYLADVKRKPNVGYDPDNFKDRKSLITARAILALINGESE